MKNKNEQLKYYLSTFIMSAVFMVAMLIVAHAKGQYLFTSDVDAAEGAKTFMLYGYEFEVGKYILDLGIVAVFPFAFTGIFALIELLSTKLKSKKKKQSELQEKSYNDFVGTVSAMLNNTHKFNVEDFRHLRENKKFQEVLKKLHLIYLEGETENNTYMLALRKFEKGTKEREAVEYLVTFTSKLISQKEEKTNE